MDFSTESTSTPGRDFRWLGSSHGTDTAQPGTLDLTQFGSIGGSYINANGIIPGGTAVTLDGTSHKYKPWVSPGGEDPDPILSGFVLEDVSVVNSVGVVSPSGVSAFALLKQGTIVRSKLPVTAQRTTITYETASDGQFVYAD